MNGHRDSEHPEAAALRQRAEQRIANRVPSRESLTADTDLHRLVHELQVHEIELAMQVEELEASRAEIEAERALRGSLRLRAHGLSDPVA